MYLTEINVSKGHIKYTYYFVKDVVPLYILAYFLFTFRLATSRLRNKKNKGTTFADDALVFSHLSKFVLKISYHYRTGLCGMFQ